MTLKIKAGTPHTLDADDNPSFEDWMSRIDRFIGRALGLSIYDLPDCHYREWYERRMRPSRAAARAVRNITSDYQL